MTSSSDRETSSERLRTAIALNTTDEVCTIFAEGRPAVVPYALPFPTPRVGRVVPGHLVAIATADNGSEVVIWRWFDAVVLGTEAGLVRLWEPAHGQVLAQPRDPHHPYPPGSRAYLSAGLPEAEWWVAGPAVDRAEAATVELGEVERFFTSNDLWGQLT